MPNHSIRVIPGSITKDEYEEFINNCCEFIPESYDQDVSAEQVILDYLKDMEKLGSIIAKLTSSYR